MEEEVIELIAEVLGVAVEDVETDTAIGDLPEWDSLHHLEIIMKLEAKYSVKFQPEDLKELEDVSDLINLIGELRNN